MSLPGVVPLEMAEFVFADDEPLAGQQGVVMAYAVQHSGGVLLFDSGFGFGSPEVDDRYHPRSRRLPDVLAQAGLAVKDVTSVVNCHLHIDHAGQNSLFPGVPIYAQPAEWEVAHAGNHTILEWIDFPDATYELRAGDYELLPGIRILSTPGHTPGHQSLVIDTPSGPIVLAGQALYSRDEWQGLPGAREGRSRAWDVAAYDESVRRLREINPTRIYFGHDREIWSA
ncbi:MAG TPA: N-acyl homoserine lactonase family protein [Candidatus Limnocylindrales bacterium]|nr:N-acyl homoserine lactonase family protein [Candidatus Limnocylindrales bacterium]